MQNKELNLIPSIPISNGVTRETINRLYKNKISNKLIQIPVTRNADVAPSDINEKEESSKLRKFIYKWVLNDNFEKYGAGTDKIVDNMIVSSQELTRRWFYDNLSQALSDINSGSYENGSQEETDNTCIEVIEFYDKRGIKPNFYAENVSIVRLLSDVEISTELDFSQRDFIFDLNGKTLTIKDNGGITCGIDNTFLMFGYKQGSKVYITGRGTGASKRFKLSYNSYLLGFEIEIYSETISSVNYNMVVFANHSRPIGYQARRDYKNEQIFKDLNITCDVRKSAYKYSCGELFYNQTNKDLSIRKIINCNIKSIESGKSDETGYIDINPTLGAVANALIIENTILEIDLQNNISGITKTFSLSNKSTEIIFKNSIIKCDTIRITNHGEHMLIFDACVFDTKKGIEIDNSIYTKNDEPKIFIKNSYISREQIAISEDYERSTIRISKGASLCLDNVRLVIGNLYEGLLKIKEAKPYYNEHYYTTLIYASNCNITEIDSNADCSIYLGEGISYDDITFNVTKGEVFNTEENYSFDYILTEKTDREFTKFLVNSLDEKVNVLDFAEYQRNMSSCLKKIPESKNVSYTIETGYYDLEKQCTLTKSFYAQILRSTKITVNAGDVYKIDGYAWNTDIPAAGVYNSTTQEYLFLLAGEGAKYRDTEIIIPEGFDTLVVNTGVPSMLGDPDIPNLLVKQVKYITDEDFWNTWNRLVALLG